MLKSTDDLRIKEIRELRTPAEVMHEFPRTDAATRTVLDIAPRPPQYPPRHRRPPRRRRRPLLDPRSRRRPRLRQAPRRPSASELGGTLEIIMRVYFEKPRTTVGWKGLINDPDLDGSFKIDNGLRLARSLLRDIADLGVPAGCEFLDMTTPQYFADLVAWGAIGARTTESQVHRELASGLSCPVGFKNGTDGNVRIALDAVKSASQPHHFLAVTKDGRSGIATTTGNDDCHIILRGGKAPNFGAESVETACSQAVNAGLRPTVMIDASHANSSKKPENQPLVLGDVGAQIAAGDNRIIGVMIESNLVAGRQDLVPGKPLTYGQSITDGCIGWDTTVETLRALSTSVAQRRAVTAQLVA